MSIPSRDKIITNDSWNLAELFRELADWETAFSEIEQSLDGIAMYKGKLCSSPEELAQALKLYYALEQKIDKIVTYTRLLADQDTTNTQSRGLEQRASQLMSRFYALTSFYNPEILMLTDDQLENFLKIPALLTYSRILRELMRMRKHSLSEKEERLIALSSQVLRAPSQIYSQLSNADLKFDPIETKEGQLPLSHSSFMSLLKNTNREVRHKTYQAYYKQFDAHKNTISTALLSSINKDIFIAQARGFESALHAAIFPDAIPPAVYKNLISSVRSSLVPMHQYYQLRKTLLGVEQQHIYDTYVSIVEKASSNTSYDQAALILRDACAPLGDDYCNILYKGLTSERWVDRYENQGKTSGAYSGGCYDSPPYILMNYKETDLRDVFTLAHEAGHSMHSYYSRKHQPYHDHDYTIFVAEVASTFNEQLLLRELKRRFANDKKMLAYLINHEIDDIKATLFRQTMFAEFELETHARVESNQAVTIDTFREIYRELLSAYFGPAVSLIDLDELEFLRIPHFYSAFYVYKYATGLAAAISLAEDVCSGDAKATKRYLNFLKAGASKQPLELLKDAGVDLTSPDPIKRACEHYGKLVEELSTILQ